MKPWRMLNAVLMVMLATLLGWACDAGSSVSDPDGDGVVVTQTLALQFFTQDTETACGTAVGIRVTISAGEETYSCDSVFAPGMISDPYTGEGDIGVHHVADCLFTLPAGTYTVEAVEVLGEEGPLVCCDADFEPEVAVTAGMTSEFGAMLTCDLASPGALDIYGWLNRPPVITKLNVWPSKFVGPCIPQFMWVTAEDRELDEITTSWQVLPSPEKLFHLWPHGPWASFMGTTGDYELLVTVSDAHGASTSLQFPLHRVEPYFVPPAQAAPTDAEPAGECPDLENEPEIPEGLGLPE